MPAPTSTQVTRTLNVYLMSLILCLSLQGWLWSGQASAEDRNVPQRRSQWFWSQRQTGNSGVSAAALRLEALQQSESLPVFGAVSWTELGPRPFFGINPLTILPDETMSGTVSAIAVDLAHDPSGNLVYLGSASGGGWKSPDGRGPPRPVGPPTAR